MLDAATSMVAEMGLTVSLAHLSFEEVIHRADVARSASYRVWPTKEDFFDELLVELAGPYWQGTAAFDQETLDLAWFIVAERADQLGTIEGRREVLLEAARVCAHRNYEAMSKRSDWRTYVALTATVISLPEGGLKKTLQERLQSSEDRFLSAMAEFYEKMAAVLGFRLKPEFGTDFRLLAAVGAAVVEGLGLRSLIAPEAVGRTFRGSLFGAKASETWTVPAVGYTSVALAMLEPDLSYDESAVPAIQKELREMLQSKLTEGD